MAKLGEGDARWIVADRQDGTNVHNWHWAEKDVLPWSKSRLAELLGEIPDAEIFSRLAGKSTCSLKTTGVDNISMNVDYPPHEHTLLMANDYSPNIEQHFIVFSQLERTLWHGIVCWQQSIWHPNNKSTSVMQLFPNSSIQLLLPQCYTPHRREFFNNFTPHNSNRMARGPSADRFQCREFKISKRWSKWA